MKPGKRLKRGKESREYSRNIIGITYLGLYGHYCISYHILSYSYHVLADRIFAYLSQEPKAAEAAEAEAMPEEAEENEAGACDDPWSKFFLTGGLIVYIVVVIHI